MTNFEYFKDEIKAVGYAFGINENGQIVNCEEINPCILCKFDEMGFCSGNRIKWLYQEHVEQPKLTKNERMLCETLGEHCYIARGVSETLFAFSKKPVKDFIGYTCYEDCVVIRLSEDIFTDCNFSFIKGEDEEPWAVSDLMKLGVKE